MCSFTACSKKEDALSSSTQSGLLPEEREVPFSRLVSRPDVFHGKRISISGYLHLGFEENAIYQHKADRKYGLHKNAFWLVLPEASQKQAGLFDDRYVVITGTFNANNYGHGRFFAGSLESVESIDILAEIDGTVPANPSYMKINGDTVSVGRVE
jgi:hypothetical protein